MTIRRYRIALVVVMVAAAVVIWANLLGGRRDDDWPLLVMGLVWFAWFLTELRSAGQRPTVGRRRMLLFGLGSSAVLIGACTVALLT